MAMKPETETKTPKKKKDKQQNNFYGMIGTEGCVDDLMQMTAVAKWFFFLTSLFLFSPCLCGVCACSLIIFLTAVRSTPLFYNIFFLLLVLPLISGSCGSKLSFLVHLVPRLTVENTILPISLLLRREMLIILQLIDASSSAC
ncbi:hypothetical protein HDV57DRAFT_224610 [Trichoderma longibrachiatum]